MSYWSRILRGLQDNKAYYYCHHTWLPTMNAWQDSVAEDTIHLASRHRRMNFKPYWVGFIVLEGAVQTSGREKTWMVFSSGEPYMLQNQSARQDVPVSVVVSQLLWGQITTF